MERIIGDPGDIEIMNWTGRGNDMGLPKRISSLVGPGGLTLFALLALIAVLTPTGARAQSPSFYPAWQDVYDRTEEARDATDGVAVRVARDDRILFEAELGFEIDRTVPIASGTKWLSAATIMTLVDDEILSLGSRVGNYFPDYVGQKGVITLAEILSYTSGLQSTECPDMTLAECAEHVLTLELHAPPGQEHRYGGLAWQVAGRMAEIAAGGIPFTRLFRERIADPLGMTETGYIDSGNPSLSGGARSNLEEYDRFLKMIMNRGVHVPEDGGEPVRVLSSESIDRMEESWTGRFGAEIVGLGSPDARYGLGVWLEGGNTPEGEPVRVHSRGAFGMSPWIERERDYRALIFMQGSFAAGSELYDDLVPLIQDAVE